MIINDSVSLSVVDGSGLIKTKDGFLVGRATISRAGNVQEYYGYELGLKDAEANKKFGVYRDPDVVFSADSMKSLAGRPVTRGHPANGVTADNWKALSVGQVGGSILRDGEHVVASMAIMDASAIAEIEAGATSLSAGYTVGIVRESGITEDGIKYDFKQAGELRFNHVAYLPDNNPRAGNTKIGDAKQEAIMQKIYIDGIPLEVNDAAHGAITSLQKKLEDSQAQVKKVEDEHKAYVAKSEKEIAAKDAEIKEAKDQALTPEKLQDAILKRSKLLQDAKHLAPDLNCEKLNDAEIRKAVVQKHADAATLEGKGDAYYEAYFDSLLAIKKPVKDGMSDAIQRAHDSNGQKLNDAQAEYVKRMTGNK